MRSSARFSYWLPPDWWEISSPAHRQKGRVQKERVFSVRMHDECRLRLLPSINSREGAVINEAEAHGPIARRGARNPTRLRRLAERSFTSHSIPRRAVGCCGKSSDTIWNLVEPNSGLG